MPFKSQAQRRKFAQLLVDGKISPDTFEEWNRETGRANLPERVGRKRATKPKRSGKRKPSARKATTAKKKTGSSKRKRSTANARSRKAR